MAAGGPGASRCMISLFAVGGMNGTRCPLDQASLPSSKLNLDRGVWCLVSLTVQMYIR